MHGINYPRLLSRLVNRPLLITPGKARELLGVIAPRAGLKGMVRMAGEDGETEGPLMISDLAAGSLSSRPERKSFQIYDGVAVIPVQGTLVAKLGTLDPYSGMTGYDGLRVKVRDAAADPDVAGILLDVESPGGEVHSSLAELAADIRAAREAKPVWCSLSDYGYSAAYWIASQADRILLPATGGAGSIGVVCQHLDWSKALDEAGLVITLIHAGAHKVDGNPYAPLPDAVRDEIQRECEDVRVQFADAVALGRGLDRAAVLATEARCFSGADAVKARLADEVLGPDAALMAFIDHLSGPAAAGSASAAGGARKTGGFPAAPTSAAAPQQERSSMTTTTTKAGASPAIIRAAGQRAECDPEEKNKDKAPDDLEEGEDEASDGKKKVGDDDKECSDPKQRIAAILQSDAAKGREPLAQHLALSTDMSVKDALAALQVSPKASSGLADRMDKMGNIDVGSGNHAPEASNGWKASAARVFGPK